jgi:hypothetical protein
MEKLLTRHFWVLYLLTLILVSYLLAGGASHLAAAALSDLLTAGEAPSQPADVARFKPPARPLPDGDDILARNIFDSSVGPILPGSGAPEPAEDNETLDPSELPVVPCPEGRYDLLATVASPGRPEWSFATVAVDRQTTLCRVGHQVGDREVSNITWRYLFLRGATDECYVDLFDATAKKKPRTASSLPSKADLKQGIRVDGPKERTVDRAVVDAALANPAQFARSVRVRPYQKDGKVTGFRLRRVQKGSPIESLGAKQGDIIHAVNGTSLTGIDQALAAYQNLRGDSQLRFDITRKGKPRTLTINIR